MGDTITKHIIMYTHTHTCIHLYILMHTPLHTHAYTSTYSCIHLYILMHTPLHTHACTSTYSCMRLYILMHTPLHTHAHSSKRNLPVEVTVVTKFQTAITKQNWSQEVTPNCYITCTFGCQLKFNYWIRHDKTGPCVEPHN